MALSGDLALEDLRVVEYGSGISAPYCAKVLADLGAHVVKIEPPETGDESRTHGPFLNDAPHLEGSGLFLYLNTSKLGITLNVQAATGRGILLRLLEGADVFVSNLPARRLDELGLSYHILGPRFPHLVMTSITAYGQTGPYRDLKAYHLNTCAAGGITSGAGRPDREPLTPPAFHGEFQAGISATVATLLALFARDGDGQGQLVDISEAQVWATLFVGSGAAGSTADGPVRRRGGNRYTSHYPDGLLVAQDGWFCIDCPQIGQWLRLVELMGTPEWTKNPRYRNRRAMAAEYPEEVDALMVQWLQKHTKEELLKLFIESRVPGAPVYTIDEIVEHPHLKLREHFVEVDHPQTGPLKYPGAAIKLAQTPGRIGHRAPFLGEHNEEVYCGMLGYSREELTAFRRAGII